MKKFIRFLCLSIIVQYIFVTALYCDEVTQLEEGQSCFDIQTRSQANGCTERFSYIKSGNLCQEVPYCKEEPGQYDCSELLAKTKGKSCFLVRDEDSNEYCIEKDLCENAKGDLTDADCGSYPVSFKNKFTHKCKKNPNGGCIETTKLCTEGEDFENDLVCSILEVSSIYNSCESYQHGGILLYDCKEVDKQCSKASPVGDEELNDSECNKNKVANETTHICIKNPDKNECYEEYLCDKVTGSNDGSTIDCSKYPVEPDKKDTHICVENKGGTNPCKSEKNPLISHLIYTTIYQTQKILKETTSLPEQNIKTTAYIVYSTQNLNLPSTHPIAIVPTTSAVKEPQDEQTPQNEVVSFIILGFIQYRNKGNSFTFIVCIVFLNSKNYSKTLITILEIIYTTYLRGLEENYNVNCTLVETNNGETANYLCEVNASTANIKQISLKRVFQFGSGGDSKLVGISPVANIYIDNIQDINDKFSEILSSNPTIYILDNSTLYRYKTYKFNIYGKMKDKEPNSAWKNKIINLMINAESEGKETIKEVSCTILDTNKNNYTLNCETNENIKYNVQSATSIIDNDILIINFDTYNNETYNSILTPENGDNILYYSNKSKGIGAGQIIAIVLVIVVVLIAIIIVIFCQRKRPDLPKNTSSTATELKNYISP